MRVNFGTVNNYMLSDAERPLSVKEKHLNFEDADAFRKFSEENPTALVRHIDVRNGNIFAQVQFIEQIGGV